MKCSYCLCEIKKGTGMMYVYRIGDIAYYCSGKCYKNDVVMERKINKKLVVREVRPKRTVEKKA